MRLSFVSCALVFLASNASADPLMINVVSVNQTTTIASHSFIFDQFNNQTRTLVSGSTALTDTMSLIPGVEAIASADPLGVELYTQAFPFNGEYPYPNANGTTHASAMSTLEFTPMSTGLAPLSIDFTAQFRGREFTTTVVSLFDLSTNTEIWTQGWGRFDEYGPAPAFGDVTKMPFDAWSIEQRPCTYRCFDDENIGTWLATITLPTFFDATHLYALTTFAFTSADKDSEYFSTRVAGVNAVPEPASLLLIGSGLALMAVRRRRQDHCDAKHT